MMVARGIMLGAQQMNRGVGKILDPARVIEIQMCQHDVAHVGGMEPERLELAQRRFLLAQLDAMKHAEEWIEAYLRRANILQHEPSIDENENVTRRFHQQTMEKA